MKVTSQYSAQLKNYNDTRMYNMSRAMHVTKSWCKRNIAPFHEAEKLEQFLTLL